ncbi:MAG: DUF5691 domain-containing protein [Erythrobacter sp.]
MTNGTSPDAILAAMMQGTARRTLAPSGVLGEGLEASDSATAPRLLALAVQAMSFDPPTPPASFDDPPKRLDAAAIVPEAARPLILRLVTGKNSPADDVAAAALAWTIHHEGLKLHPFDMVRLLTFTSKNAETLGIESGADKADYWNSAPVLDASNWAHATSAMKAQFIAGLRAEDPVAARELVEAQLPLEKAPVRVRLIDALATGLSGEDLPMLETLAKDRAPTVKQAVKRLLARIPGSGAATAQVEELASRIERRTAGLLRKRTMLDLQLPTNLRSEPAIIEWLANNFCAVSNRALAAAFAMDPPAMLDAARDDGRLLTGIAFAACAERDWALLGEIAQNYRAGMWKDFLETGLAAFGLTTLAERREWIAAAMPRMLDEKQVAAQDLQMLHSALGGPLPLAHARAVHRIAHRIMPESPEAMTAAVALTPPEGLAEYASALEKRSPDQNRRARLLARTLLSLNQGRTRP